MNVVSLELTPDCLQKVKKCTDSAWNEESKEVSLFKKKEAGLYVAGAEDCT